MITLNYKNLTKIAPKHGLSIKEIQKKTDLIETYLKKIHSKKQGFYNYLDNSEIFKEIIKFTKTTKNKYKNFIVLGIGGSALGTICLKQTFSHLFKTKNPQLHIIDNIDPELITELEENINLKETLFIVITKSGKTPETISQYFYFRNKINEKKLNPENHFIFITNSKTGLLKEISEKEQIKTFEIPENIGGRFSVLTPVGLFPASLININIENLIKGAKKIRESFLNTNFNKNLPFQLATIQYLLYKKQKTINIIMPYSQKLIKFTDWYKQLLAESIGKKLNTGITPVNALGATDQHSQSQLYNEGPNDKLIIFIEIEKFKSNPKIPNIKLHTKEFNFLKNKTFTKLLQTEKYALEQSLTENSRPNITIKIKKLDEESLGELFMLLECSTAFLGEFFKINAFNQPGVELTKNLTKKMLS